MSIAGHVSRAMLSRYSHVRMEAKRRALDEIAARQGAADERRKTEADRREQDGGDDGWLQRIVDTFHPNPAELEHDLAETERTHQREHDDAMREIEDRERRRFRPIIWIVTEDGAHSFLTAIAERQLKGALACSPRPKTVALRTLFRLTR